jgi:natural product precursor
MKGIKIKKLQLNKQTISSLNNQQMHDVKGGGALTKPSIGGPSYANNKACYLKDREVLSAAC